MPGPAASGSVPHIRRQPSTAASAPTTAPANTESAIPADDARTNLIRRAPLAAEPATTQIAGAPIPDAGNPSGHSAIGASAAAIVGGWATAVVTTDLITGWWATDRVFCLAVGFLALLFATTTVAGVILLLLRRSVGRWLIVFGSAVALLTFGSVFLAGARVARPVYAVPILPLASMVLALHPSTRRWSNPA